ncbi:MAG: FliI/YscN family ATPase [Candidatus Dadabacteria bacterium]|nr:MAG: FliI/YscN family ATPase [Candidatus Dadabacteria bacterium]
MSTIFENANAALKLSSNFELRGNVRDVTGMVIEGSGPFVPVGSHVTIRSGLRNIPAQVVGFRQDRILLMPFTDLEGISPGASIIARGTRSDVLVSEKMLGRVLNGLGQPIDHKPLAKTGELAPLYRDPPNPVTRKRIDQYFDLGVRSINSLLTVGAGQRIGIMAGSGVGKSTLLGMIARHSSSDVNVIGLVGERGREVREFIERDLGDEGLKRSVLVVATGNESPLLRIRAAMLATTIAEFFRDRGKKVVLMLDSVTRLAMAQREIGLAIGEPPSTRGYTPSVFSLLPRLLERAGTSDGEGSITGIYTILVEGDDMNEPIADATRGILDGHIELSRRLAGRGHYPAVEVLGSVSRVMPDIVPPEILDLAAQARDVLATYREAEDLITIGAYKPGQNARVDKAVALIDKLNDFLRQKATERVSIEESWQQLKEIFESVDEAGGGDAE